MIKRGQQNYSAGRKRSKNGLAISTRLRRSASSLGRGCELAICTESISGGSRLLYGGKAVPPGRPGSLVSSARSGDSPESSGALELLLDTEPEYRHVVVTCNEQGSLARAWCDHEKVRVTTLP